MSILIIGATKSQQAISNASASGIILSDDIIAEIEKILDYKPFYRKIG